MTRLFLEAISQIIQIFSGSNSNNCIGQVQNSYLQEIISSCSNIQQLPFLQSKEIQQFQSSITTIPVPSITSCNENRTFLYFSNFTPQISDVILPFLDIFKSKIPLFDRKINQEVQFIYMKLKSVSEINPKKLLSTGTKENLSNFSLTNILSSSQPESETIARIALTSFLSFIHSIYKDKTKNQKQPNPNLNEENNDEKNTNSYFFDISVYSVLFNLIILSIQLKPSKSQIMDSLKLAMMILLEIFISESFKQYNILYPPPKKVLQRISTTPIIDENMATISKEESENGSNKEKDEFNNTENTESIEKVENTESIEKVENTKNIEKFENTENIEKVENTEKINSIEKVKKVTFDKDEFCSILNNILTCLTTNLSLFFPGFDRLLVGIEKHVSSDHRSELHFFDKQLIKFITRLASNSRPSTFSVETARSLILLASGQLLKFDKDSLDYFIALSKHNDDSSNTQIVLMLVNSLTIELPKERITDADNEIIKLTTKLNKDKVQKFNENDEISLFPNHEYLNDCFFQPDTKYVIDLIVDKYLYSHDEDFTSFKPYIQEGYSKLVSKRVYKIITILSESFRRSNVMLDKLYTTFGKAISNSSSLFDSLCLFVVFYLESKSKWHFEPSTNPASFLILQHLFSRTILTKRATIVQRLQMYAIGILIDKSESDLLQILQNISKSFTNDEKDKNLNLPTSPLFVLQILEGLIVNYRKLVILLTNSSDAVLEPLSNIMDEMRKISYNENYISDFNVTYEDIEPEPFDKKKEPHFTRDIDRVRYTFLILVSLIFENNEAKKILIDNLSFTKTFIDFVFEGKNVKEYILSQLESALVTSKCDPSIAFIPNVTKIFDFICKDEDFSDINKAFYISKDILSMVNQTLLNRRDLCKNFIEFSPKIFQLIFCIQKVDNNDESSIVLFRELIEFLSRISAYLNITDQDKEIIKNTIQSIWPNNSPPNWLYYLLVKLMVPDEKLIRQPVLLHLIFAIFNNDEYLKFLCDLLEKNTFNVEKVCSVSFDQTIFKSLISDHSNFEKQTLIQKLFTNISLIQISPNVVYQYLRLLSPTDSFHLNENMPMYLNYLNELFVLSLETQHESWPLNPGHSQKPATFNLSSNSNLKNTSPKRTVNCFGDGFFTFVFWLKVEEMSPTYFPLIFSAKDERGNVYEVFIKGRKICINYDRIRNRSSLSFNFVFNKDEWYFISLSFSKQQENESDANFVVASMNINDNKDCRYELKFPLSQMVTGNTTFVFGGVLHEYSISSNNPCLLGPFALFNMLLRHDKLQSLYKQEQRFFCREVKDQSRLHVYQPYAIGPLQNQKNFASTLVLNVKMEVFIPLFLLIPMKFENGTSFDNYVVILIDIIKHGLNFGSIVEESFYHSNGFGIISFILSQNKYHEYCDYHLYCQFYSLFLNLMTDKLKTEMIKNILLNFDLWSRIEKADEIVQIFDNWLNALFPHNLQIISKIYSFSSLLNMIVFNFCHKEDEHLVKFQYELPQLSKSFLMSFSSNENRKTNLNLTEIQRQTINDILFQILLFYSVSKFTFDDYVLLVSYLSNSNSYDLITNIKKLLLQMIILKPSPLESVFENHSALTILHQIFKTDKISIEAIEATIEIIVFLHKASMINGNQFIPLVISNSSSYSSNIQSSITNIFSRFSFSSLRTVNFQEFSLIDHLYTISQQIPKEIFCQRDFFNRLLNLTEKASHEIFPFACWSCFCIFNTQKEDKKELLFSLFDNLEPSHEYVTPHWSLIPILLVIKVNDKNFANKMINFLIDCCKGDEWFGIYFTISILCSVFKVNPMKFQRIFLLKILNEAILKKSTLNEILIQICTSYIFYRNIEFDNIGKFFNDSPFRPTKQALKNSNENKMWDFNSLTTICSFISSISNVDLTSLKTVSYFGLRFHKMSGKWIDRDISLLLLTYTNDHLNNESIYCLRLLLIYYILHQNDDTKNQSLVTELERPNFTNSNNDNNGFSFNNFMNMNENSHVKKPDILQILIDLVCFQIEKIGLSEICPLFKNHSENFRVNGNQFFSIVSFLFDDREMYYYFFTNNFVFSKRIQDILSEILKLANNKGNLPLFFCQLEAQQQCQLRQFLDFSCFDKFDTLRVFEFSQMETIVKKINDTYKCKHLFKDLFESITTSNAPLFSLNRFKKNGRAWHMKRDKTLVAQLIPLRMKTCWMYDSHADALQASAAIVKARTSKSQPAQNNEARTERQTQQQAGNPQKESVANAPTANSTDIISMPINTQEASTKELTTNAKTNNFVETNSSLQKAQETSADNVFPTENAHEASTKELTTNEPATNSTEANSLPAKAQETGAASVPANESAQGASASASDSATNSTEANSLPAKAQETSAASVPANENAQEASTNELTTNEPATNSTEANSLSAKAQETSAASVPANENAQGASASASDSADQNADSKEASNEGHATDGSLSTSSAASKHFSKVPSLAMQDSPQPVPGAPSKGSSTRVRRISTMMKKRLMLSASSCFVNIYSDCVKKNCELVSIDKTEDAFLSLSPSELKILKLKNFKLVHVYFSEVKRVTRTTYLHKPISLQIITRNGTEFFVNFDTRETREALYNFIFLRANTKYFSFVDQVEKSTQLWLDGSMTNFEYLLVINMAGGRSFQNSSQYPIFPFIFNNYNREISKSSSILNFLRDPQIYRNLAKPSGCLDNAKFEVLKKNQSILKKIESNNHFLFATGASNPQILYGEMARIEPFLSLYITLHGGQISPENKSSLLTSIPSLYENVLHDMTDFRELSPEFFSISPEFLEKPSNDIEKVLNFGNVFLPPWFSSFDESESNMPAEFLYLHRKALESNCVRASLNYWIDLLFGINQRSENNVYENSLYEDSWKARKVDVEASLQSKKKNQKRKNQEVNVKAVNCQNDEFTYNKELEASKRVLGQVPLKVFNKPHPQCTIILSAPRKTIRASSTHDKDLNLNLKLIKKEQVNSSKDNQPSSSRTPSFGNQNKHRQSLKNNKILSQSLIHINSLQQTQIEKSKDDDLIGNVRSKRFYSINERPDEIQGKKQQSRLRQFRDMHFDIHRVDLKRKDLIYASVYSATKKAIKIHTIDKFENRYLFTIDGSSYDMISAKSFTGKFLNNNISKQIANQDQNQSSQKVDSVLNSILSIASFRDCLFIVTKDKSFLLGSDGSVAIDGKLIDPEISNSNTIIDNTNSLTIENPDDLFQKKYLNVACDSESLVAIGTDSLIDLFKSSSRVKTDSLKETTVNGTVKAGASGINNVDINVSLNTKSGLIESSHSLDLSNSSFDLNQLHQLNQNADAMNFFFSDTLLMIKSPKRSFHFFSEYKVTCSAVSSFLNSVAIASNDGNILLYSLNQGSSIIEINLPSSFIAQKIIFANSLGLVVVYATMNKSSTLIENEILNNDVDDIIHSIFVFTINGELIRRRTIPCGKEGISQMTSFLSMKGIDYIAIITKSDNSLHICEAFLLNFENFNSPQQIEKTNNSNTSNLDPNSTKVNDSPLLIHNSSNENILDDENSLLKRQLNIPFPSILKFDDDVIYIGFKRKHSSLLYITVGGEFGSIQINRLVIEEY